MSNNNKSNDATEALLDLAQPRTVVLVDRERTFTLNCRRITDADWKAFFEAGRISSEGRGRDRMNVIDTTSPMLALAETVLEDASGYKLSSGKELRSLPDWQQKIPMAHRLKLGEVLSDARPSPADDELLIHEEGEIVSLDATWTAVKHEDGSWAMRRFSGLKHVLAQPSQAQYTRYASEASRSLIVGGSRSGKTVYLGATGILAKLYDELIVSVDGYCVNGSHLGGKISDIRREMDMHHKVMAAQQIFQPQSSVTAELEAQE